MIGAVEDGVLVGETSEEEILAADVASAEDQIGQCLRQSVVIAAKNAKYLLGQPAQNQFIVASVLKKEVEMPDTVISRTGLRELMRLNMDKSLAP